VEDEAGKEGAEGAALGGAFLLEKGGPGGGFGTEPAGVGGVVEHVEEGDEAAEGGVVFYSIHDLRNTILASSWWKKLVYFIPDPKKSLFS
jgi:hypothetical protein